MAEYPQLALLTNCAADTLATVFFRDRWAGLDQIRLEEYHYTGSGFIDYFYNRYSLLWIEDVKVRSGMCSGIC